MLLDWIAKQQIFAKDQLIEALSISPITISDNLSVANEVALNLLRVLEQNRYLRLLDGRYRVVWDRHVPPKPRKVKPRKVEVEIFPSSSELSQPSSTLPETKTPTHHPPNLKNIRALLTMGFSAEELLRLCYEEPEFRAVYDDLPKDTGIAELAFKLVTYADQKGQIEKLLSLAKEHNPARYAKHQPYY